MIQVQEKEGKSKGQFIVISRLSFFLWPFSRSPIKMATRWDDYCCHWNCLLKLKTLSQREIAKSVGMSQKGVHTIKKRLHSGLTSSPQQTKSGRKPIVTQRVRRILLMECKKNRKMTSKQLQGSLQHHNIHISTSCVRRQLIQAGFVARRPRRKPLLNNKQNKQNDSSGLRSTNIGPQLIGER